MANHHFNAELASIVGVDAAILFENIYAWSEKNAVTGYRSKDPDEPVWVFLNGSVFAKLFPYFIEDEVNRALEKLERESLINTGGLEFAHHSRRGQYAIDFVSIEADAGHDSFREYLLHLYPKL